MRIFNKFVESKKAPQNYQDIWFDGSVVRLYKQGSWEEVSLPIEDLKMLQSFVSTAEVFQIVTELPEEGLADYIYVLLNVTDQNPSIKLYTYVDSTWEEIGGMASSSLLKLSDCLIPFIPKKQSIITTEDFKEIVEKYDLINKKGISLACLYKTNNKNYSFGILTFSENNEYQRVDILSNHAFNDFKTDEKLYNPFNSYENTAWLYNTQYNILTPLGTYTSPEYSPIKDESVTKAKLSKEVQEMLENPTDGPSGEYITPDWNALEGEPGYIENKPNLDVPFEKGDAENSAVLKGEYEGYSNKAISQTSMAIGAATTAGLKGWYYSAIDFTNNIITLSDKQPLPIAGKLVMGDWKSGTPNISVGDKVSIVNNSKYDYCGEVKSISGNKVTLKSALPFDTLDVGNIPVNNPDDWTIYLPDKPDAGIIDFGGGALSEGVNTKATNIGSHAEGIQTHAYGQYSHTEGFDTKAGYAAHAEGRETNAKGEQSHTEGRNTIASGHCSHAEGRNTVSSGANSHAEGEGMTVEGITSLLVGAHGRSSHVEGIATTTGEYNEQTGVWSKGDAAHAEGNNTIASGNHSHTEGSGTQASGWQAHAEGHNTLAKGNRSHAEGSGTEAYNLAEHAQGSFNKSTESNDKSKATQFSIGIGTSENDRKNAFEVKQNGDIYVEGVEGRIQDKLDKLVNITYSELKSLRDNSKLVPGQQYRIIDYTTTTTQANTQSAGHQFDIIVIADDVNVLNENARAIQHEGDTYFTDSNLSAWQIWYCLDNDTSRFAWAIVDAIKVYDAEDDSSLIYKRHKLHDTNLFAWAKVLHSDDVEFEGVYDWYNLDDSDLIFTESENIALGSTFIRQGDISVEVVDIQYGKGVIYRMIDEWNNDCPYDFKNIQFKRNLNLTDGLAEFSENGEETWVYTFAGQSYHINNDECSDMLDGSLESPFGHMSDEKTSTFHDNVIKPYIKLLNWETEDRTKVGVRYLNDIVFLGYWEKIGSANEEDAPYYYAYCCYSNSFGNNCYSNSFGNNCYSNSFGNNCYSNSFGNDCHSNSFGNNCYHNSFSYGCHSNSFGNDCLDNSFGKGCVSNSFGNNCYSNSVGEDISYATLLSGVTDIEGIGQSHAMVARNSAGVVKIFNIADLVE